MSIQTPNFDRAVGKAVERARSLGIDLEALAERTRDARPEQLASAREKTERRRFLESLYDERREGEQAYERIIAGNELQDANFLARGALVVRTVLRIVLRRPGGGVLGTGTGFLIGDGVLITNNHVLPRAEVAESAEAEALYERDLYGQDAEPWRFALEPERLFYTCEPLDFTVVAIAETARGGQPLSALGWLPLIGGTGKVAEGEWLSIVQHPKGERKQLCVRENQLLKRDDDVLWYSTDTLGGSSGSPVFNNDWLVVALHHMGVPKTVDGRWQTIDGRDYDRLRDPEDSIQWEANEGIRVSRIVETLRSDAAVADHPLVRASTGFAVGDVRARLPVFYREGVAPPELARPPAVAPTQPEEKDPAMSRRITVTLDVDDDGRVTLVDQSGQESDTLLDERGARKPRKNLIYAPVEPETDWIGGGYDPGFLGDGPLRVNLPEVGDAELIAPLKAAYGWTPTDAESAAGVLTYKGYSVVMNRRRRFAFFSAANVDGGMMPKISGRDDNWMFDDRIARDHQVDNSFYKGTRTQPNRFDRGHLTRRDDMEWGRDPVDAVNRANGTCTWTNCAPQHERFNKGQDKSVELWGNLEKYILEQTIDARKFRVQVISGPVFGVADPTFRGIAYPLEYWKVIAAVTGSGKLFATAYLLGQKATIDKFGIEVDTEQPFGAFAAYQRSIRVIEDLTGLTFSYGDGQSLREVDPLAKPRRGRPRRSDARESFGEADDDRLGSLADIVLA